MPTKTIYPICYCTQSGTRGDPEWGYYSVYHTSRQSARVQIANSSSAYSVYGWFKIDDPELPSEATITEVTLRLVPETATSISGTMLIRSIGTNYSPSSGEVETRHFYTLGNSNSSGSFSSTRTYDVTTAYVSALEASYSYKYISVHLNREATAYAYADGASTTSNRPVFTITYSLPTPSVPSSVTIPQDVRSGNSFTVSWGASSVQGGGYISYYLERSINGGPYSQIHVGGSLNYVDTAVHSWDTVSYRVSAYANSNFSGYRTSSIRTVKHFPEFYPKVNGNIVTSDNGWVKIDGALREVESISIKVDGILKEV